MAHDRTRVLGVLGYRRMSEDVGASIRTSCWAAHVHCLSPIIWPVVINGAASECHNVERPVTRVLGKPASRSGSTRFLYTPPSCSSPPSEAEAAPRRFVTAVVGVGVPVESVAGAAMVGGAGRGCLVRVPFPASTAVCSVRAAVACTFLAQVAVLAKVHVDEWQRYIAE